MIHAEHSQKENQVLAGLPVGGVQVQGGGRFLMERRHTHSRGSSIASGERWMGQHHMQREARHHRGCEGKKDQRWELATARGGSSDNLVQREANEWSRGIHLGGIGPSG